VHAHYAFAAVGPPHAGHPSAGWLRACVLVVLCSIFEFFRSRKEQFYRDYLIRIQRTEYRLQILYNTGI